MRSDSHLPAYFNYETAYQLFPTKIAYCGLLWAAYIKSENYIIFCIRQNLEFTTTLQKMKIHKYLLIENNPSLRQLTYDYMKSTFY